MNAYMRKLVAEFSVEERLCFTSVLLPSLDLPVYWQGLSRHGIPGLSTPIS